MVALFACHLSIHNNGNKATVGPSIPKCCESGQGCQDKRSSLHELKDNYVLVEAAEDKVIEACTFEYVHEPGVARANPKINKDTKSAGILASALYERCL